MGAVIKETATRVAMDLVVKGIERISSVEVKTKGVYIIYLILDLPTPQSFSSIRESVIDSIRRLGRLEKVPNLNLDMMVCKNNARYLYDMYAFTQRDLLYGELICSSRLYDLDELIDESDDVVKELGLSMDDLEKVKRVAVVLVPLNIEALRSCPEILRSLYDALTVNLRPCFSVMKICIKSDDKKFVDKLASNIHRKLSEVSVYKLKDEQWYKLVVILYKPSLIAGDEIYAILFPRKHIWNYLQEFFSKVRIAKNVD